MLLLSLSGTVAAQTPIHEPFPDYTPPRIVMGSTTAGPGPKLAAAASLSLWFTVALGGRLIGFP